MGAPGFTPSGFFALRTPLLPFDAFEAWCDGLASPRAAETGASLEEALQADRALQRRRLRDVVETPAFREALFLASPDLHDSLDAWLSCPEGERGQRVERALVKYFSRAAGRATPFGLFAGVSVGRTGGATRLEIEGRESCRRHSRLDMDFLFALRDALSRDPGRRGGLLFRPNSSLYESVGRLRYVESRLKGEERTYHLVALESSPALRDTLARAAAGARAADLAAALVDPESSREECQAFVDELIDAQVLVPDVGLVVTGGEPTRSMAETLAGGEATADVAASLAFAEEALGAIDAGGLGADPSRYREIAARLETLPAKPALHHLVQVDLVKGSPAAALGDAVLDEIARGVELARRLSPAEPGDELSKFRDAFRERYETREVALVDVLDEDSGIGFPAYRSDTDGPSPLLDGLPDRAAGGETAPWGRREKTLLRMLGECLAAGAREIRLGPKEVDALSVEAPLPLPGAFAVMARVAAAPAGGGDFQVVLESIAGPSGALLLGRFCHADPSLARLVQEHLRAEEALDPEAVFAEIVHLPEGRVGNVLLRPVLRGYEVPYLGGSGAPAERCLPVGDLLVSVRGDRVELRSRRLGRRVVPRLTSAHNFTARSLGTYRFLCSLQAEGTFSGPAWSWGPLAAAPFLPRVVHGRLVLSPSSWVVRADELRKLAETRSADRYAAVREWRALRGLPRLVVVADGDNELPVDLDSPLSIESFVHLVKSRDAVRLEEMLPEPERLATRGPEGRFVHEIVVPFVSAPRPSESRALAGASPATRPTPGIARTLPPGSEWLYAKVYTGSATADRVLLESVAPVAREAVESGAADLWHFVRYSDPRFHVRVRFHGDPQRLRRDVLPALQDAFGPALAGGLAWRLQLDSYEREIERYGGPEAILASERLFHADSEAVIDILESIEPGDDGADERWRMAVAGIHALLNDLGLDLDGKRRVVGEARASFGAEHREDAALTRALGERYRKESRALSPLLDPEPPSDHPLAPGFDILKRRSARLAPIVDELRALERDGRATRPIAAMAASYAHMYVNRLLRANHRRQELVLYDLLSRAYAARAARGLRA